MAQLDPILENLCSLLNKRSLLQTLGVFSEHEAMDVVHTLCVPSYMWRWTLSRNVVFVIEHKKVDRTQEHRLLHWTRTGDRSTETSHTSLNMRVWAEFRNFLLFIEQTTVGRTPEICAFFGRRWWTGSRNFILFIEHEKVGWVQKLNILSLWIKPTDALNSSFISITNLHVSGSLSAHHQEFLAVHLLWYILCSCDEPFATRSRMALQCHPTPGSKRSQMH